MNLKNIPVEFAFQKHSCKRYHRLQKTPTLKLPLSKLRPLTLSSYKKRNMSFDNGSFKRIPVNSVRRRWGTAVMLTHQVPVPPSARRPLPGRRLILLAGSHTWYSDSQPSYGPCATTLSQLWVIPHSGNGPSFTPVLTRLLRRVKLIRCRCLWLRLCHLDSVSTRLVVYFLLISWKSACLMLLSFMYFMSLYRTIWF